MYSMKLTILNNIFESCLESVGCEGGQEELPWPEGRGGGLEELPHNRGQEKRLCFAGAAVKRDPMSKVRETQVRW